MSENCSVTKFILTKLTNKDLLITYLIPLFHHKIPIDYVIVIPWVVRLYVEIIHELYSGQIYTTFITRYFMLKLVMVV